MKPIREPAVEAVFNAYPEGIRERMFALRELVFQTAAETDGVGTLEETLKWGEPSYLAKAGSTVRMDWKPSRPAQYALYFHCQTQLVETFRELYPHSLSFEGKRAIVLPLDGEVPVEDLKHCIALALTYHRRKHLPMLGA